jgi:MraZ protein
MPVTARPDGRAGCVGFRQGWVGVVDRFVSNFTNKLDAKGRVSIPAPFRSVLAKDGFEGLYVYPSLDAPALDCGGNALLGEIDGLLAMFSPYSEERDMFSTALLGTSEILKIDSEGRMILSENLKAAAGISSEVSFVGQGQKFQIWEPGRFRAHLEEAKTRMRDLRQKLSSRHAAEATPPRQHGARE